MVGCFLSVGSKPWSRLEKITWRQIYLLPPALYLSWHLSWSKERVCVFFRFDEISRLRHPAHPLFVPGVQYVQDYVVGTKPLCGTCVVRFNLARRPRPTRPQTQPSTCPYILPFGGFEVPRGSHAGPQRGWATFVFETTPGGRNTTPSNNLTHIHAAKCVGRTAPADIVGRVSGESSSRDTTSHCKTKPMAKAVILRFGLEIASATRRVGLLQGVLYSLTMGKAPANDARPILQYSITVRDNIWESPILSKARGLLWGCRCWVHITKS